MSLRSLILSLVIVPLAALGCGPAGSGATSSGAGSSGAGGHAGGPTWADDVAPIVMKNCAGCHVTGGIAPFSLLTYAQAAPLAGSMKAATASRTMPPFNLDDSGDCNTFADARWLDDADLATIAAWAEAGAPEGDPAHAPQPPPPATGLTGKSLTLDMGTTYTPDASATDEYRCFIVDPGLTADRFLTGYQVHPGDQRVVHHMILFGLDTAAAESEAAALDAADPKDGYLCFGGPGVSSSRFLLGWAPGGGATYYPADTGVRALAGHKMVMQIHYNLANGSFPDRTTIDVALTDAVGKEAVVSRVAAATKTISLPPGQALVTVSGEQPVPVKKGPLTIWGVAPHMHTRGKTQDAWYQDGTTKTCLSKVSNWNFHWQSLWLYDKPITLPPGGTLGVTCGYDTTHETMTITGGEGTANEMCIDFLYVTN